MVIPPAPHPMAQTHQEALGKPKPPLFQPGGRGEAATRFGGRGDTTGTYFSRCRCQSCAREERWLCQLPSACNRLRFLLFIPRFELRHVAAEAFGSLRKGFIASFLTSAQTSTSLAWGWGFFPPLYHPPLCTFLLLAVFVFLPPVSGVGWGAAGGRFITAEAVLPKEGVSPDFF